MDKNIKLVVCIAGGKWTEVPTGIPMKAGPSKGEICTVEYEGSTAYAFVEYPQNSSDGTRDMYRKNNFIEITNSKEEIATVQVQGIQIPELCNQ
jgi:hypothetical protein